MSSNSRTATFLFTDLENSTPLWENHPELMPGIAARHDTLMRKAIEAHRGRVVKTTGDGFHAVFDAVTDGIAAAVAGQRAMIEESWPAETGPIHVRMGLHTGESQEREGDFYGSEVNRAARVMGIANGGQILLSEAATALIRKALPLDVSLLDLGPHRLKGITATERIFQLCHPAIPADFPPLKALSATPSNIPVQVTPLVGRQDELTTLRALLTGERRLVTLVGPGGIGKTRLAIEVASELLHSFPDGVYFVPLAPLNSASQIVQAIVEVLGVSFAGGGDLKQLLFRYLRRRQALLLLDNFEHLLDGTPLLAEILQATPNITLVATSREKLNLRSETIFNMTGLGFADWNTPEELLAHSCGELFVQSALRAYPAFELRSEDVQPVAQICRLVGGMPLGVLLAAAWVDQLTPGEIAAEVSQSLDFLETEMRDVPARQRSIRAVFETSWERLSGTERELFKKLSIFRGGFTRQAAREVTGATIRELAALVNKSFLRRNSDTGRYSVHELLRQYAAERLEIEPETILSVRDAHGAFFAKLTEDILESFRSARQKSALDEFEADLENVRLAWRYLAAADKAAEMSGMIETLWFFHDMRGWEHALMDLIAAAEKTFLAAEGDEESDVVAAQIQSLKANCMMLLGSSQQGREMADEAQSILRSLDRRKEMLLPLSTLFISDIFLNRGAEAVQTVQELLEIAIEVGDEWWVATGLTGLGSASMAAQAFDDARRYAEEATKRWARIGDPTRPMFAEQTLAGLAAKNGRLEEARKRYQLVLERVQSVNFKRGLQYTHTNLGNVNFRLKDYWEAETHYLQSLAISDEIGQTREMLSTLYDIARVWAATENAIEAVEILAIVLQHPVSSQYVLLGQASIQENAEALRGELQGLLPPEVYAATWERGSGRELQSIVDEILTTSGRWNAG